MRRAVTMTWKHSSMVAGASTTLGESPGWPKHGRQEVGLLDLGGEPVLGPPRCTSTTTSGISAMTANPMNSVFSANRGRT